MAAGDSTLYTKHLRSLFDGDSGGDLSNTPIDLNTDTLKLVVLKDTFTPDTTGTSTQEHFDDISAQEVATATAYTGPITLTSATVTESGGVITFDADDISIAIDAGGFTDARRFAIYKDSGTPSTSPIFYVGDLGINRANTINGLDFEWGAAGIFTMAQV